MPTWEELFQKAVSGVVQQGSLCFDGNACLYRGPGGRKCPVGILISDTDYNPKMEYQSPFDLEENNLLPAELVPFVNRLALLQSAHDNAHDGTLGLAAQLQAFLDNCQKLADEWGIKMPESPAIV